MTLYNLNKSPLRNVSLFIYHKFGWDMEQKYIVYRNKQIDFGKITVVKISTASGCMPALGQLKTVAHWRYIQCFND